jgi:hypothetical protein
VSWSGVKLISSAESSISFLGTCLSVPIPARVVYRGFVESTSVDGVNRGWYTDLHLLDEANRRLKKAIPADKLLFVLMPVHPRDMLLEVIEPWPDLSPIYAVLRRTLITSS